VITENVFLIATLTAWTEEYSVCLQKGHIVFFAPVLKCRKKIFFKLANFSLPHLLLALGTGCHFCNFIQFYKRRVAEFLARLCGVACAILS